MIEVTGLEKWYATFQALKSISFTVPEGEVTGFLGPNGAGKTTTLRILSGFMPTTQGTVKIDGLDIRDRSRDARRRVGYLPEDVPLYRDLSVESFLAYMAGLKEVPRAQIASEIERVVAATGLEPVAKRLRLGRPYLRSSFVRAPQPGEAVLGRLVARLRLRPLVRISEHARRA